MSNRVSRRQGRRWAAQEQQQYDADQYQQQQQQPQYAQPPAPPRDTVTQLKELAELKNQGVLTDAEFAAQKAKILGS
ncbi:MAG TPA: SHOCT domain-containing protein [Actinophytocola sp.]|uniref:SHOCT domain-containing protein n=1 Tax=Actinophytocola sp. TaxID=1872138 RepID=UPI002F9289DD